MSIGAAVFLQAPHKSRYVFSSPRYDFVQMAVRWTHDIDENSRLHVAELRTLISRRAAWERHITLRITAVIFEIHLA